MAASNPHPQDAPLVLVVDDDSAVRDLTSAVLERSGYSVIRAEDGEDAVRQFESRVGEIQLVVTDVNMPNMDGGTLIQALRRLRPDIAIVAISGMDPGRPTSKGPPPEASAFLLKPYSIESLLAAVGRFVPRPGAGN